MKKFLCMLLALMLILSTASAALAATEINPKEKRGIKLQKVEENPVYEGVSPTTGLTLDYLYVPDGYTGLAATGRYMPMLVQIGNDDGGVGHRAPWGLGYVDIVYEIPLHRSGNTRLTAVFSDLIPDSVGYVRSARVGNAWLWKEWLGGFLFYGQQEAKGSNVEEEFQKMGHHPINDPLLFSGMVGSGKEWKQYYNARKGLKTPYHIDANVAEMSKLIPEDQVAPNHAYKFTDETPEGGDIANEIYIKWAKSSDAYDSHVVYNADLNSYERYMGKDREPWIEKDTEEQIVFSNVIVQFTEVTYNKSAQNPVVEMVGEGNADFFMCGKHFAGYWKRDSLESRTVFYGPDGNEIELQRGKTLIVVFPDDDENEREVSYQ